MNNKVGHIKEKAKDDEGYNQFIVNCIGVNDQRKYYSVTPFGFNFNAPKDTRSVTIDSQNKDQSFNIGVLSKVEAEDLGFGESIMFSTDEDGLGFVSKVVCRNTGDIEINKGMSNGNILIKADGTIEFNGNADFLTGFTKNKEGFDQLVSDYNSAIAEVNKITVALTAWIVVPQDGGLALKTAYLGNPSITIPSTSASINDSKKENLKCE